MRTFLFALAILTLAGLGYYYAYEGRTSVSIPANMSTNGSATSSPAGSSPQGAASIPMTIVALKEQASTTFSVSAEYPQFPSLPASLNSEIAAATLTRLSDFRKEASSTMAARLATGDPAAAISPAAYSFIARWEPAQVNDRYVSFIMRFDSYTGGANENQELQTFDYDVRAKKLIGLSDLFGTSTDYLSKLSRLSREQLRGSMGSVNGGMAPTDMIDAGTEPVYDNFKNFTFTDYALTVYFPKYSVGPGAFGEQHAAFGWSSIR